uniref:INO80 complex subunit E N-terminal domain-containing protein n=1 Tax=Tabanus bromius TaxID=304241 RepID=A0A0K8TPQ6_TABBR
MLGGWFCRAVADDKQVFMDRSIDVNHDCVLYKPTGNNYQQKYRYLILKLKFLIYENEFLRDALRSSERKLLKISRDRSFLLDRLFAYERPQETSSEAEDTESSYETLKYENKRRKTDLSSSGVATTILSTKRRKTTSTKSKLEHHLIELNPIEDGQMTPEEVERHLQSRKPNTDFMAEKAPSTVPNEMFSNDPSLDSESNDPVCNTSPRKLPEECLSISLGVINCEYNP